MIKIKYFNNFKQNQIMNLKKNFKKKNFKKLKMNYKNNNKIKI